MIRICILVALTITYSTGFPSFSPPDFSATGARGSAFSTPGPNGGLDGKGPAGKGSAEKPSFSTPDFSAIGARGSAFSTPGPNGGLADKGPAGKGSADKPSFSTPDFSAIGARGSAFSTPGPNGGLADKGPAGKGPAGKGAGTPPLNGDRSTFRFATCTTDDDIDVCLPRPAQQPASREEVDALFSARCSEVAADKTLAGSCCNFLCGCKAKQGDITSCGGLPSGLVQIQALSNNANH